MNLALTATLSVLALAALAVGAFGALRSERREHARERQLLLNQLLHTAGKPWQPAPADHPKPVETPELGPPRFTAHPERYQEE